MIDYAHIHTRTIVMSPREFWSLLVAASIACMIAGVLACGLFVLLVLDPLRTANTAQAVSSAYAKGAMVKIAASPARCQQWELRQRRAVCE